MERFFKKIKKNYAKYFFEQRKSPVRIQGFLKIRNRRSIQFQIVCNDDKDQCAYSV